MIEEKRLEYRVQRKQQKIQLQGTEGSGSSIKDFNVPVKECYFSN